MLPSVISMFREKHSAATEHLGSSQSSAQSTLGWAVIIGDRWRKVGEGPAIRPQPWQVTQLIMESQRVGPD